MKFGGTSVGNRDRVKASADIIETQPLPRAVVVSAASGVTNLLLEAATAAEKNDLPAAREVAAAIRAVHDGVSSGISDDSELQETTVLLDALHQRLDKMLEALPLEPDERAKRMDEIVSTGEKAMSIMMAATLRSRGVPATHLFASEVIATDDRFGNAKPDRERTREQAAHLVIPLLADGQTVVMTGFIGAAPDGSTTTLGRGGSDYSATLLGAAIDATEVQIWTDVPGVLSADPRLVEDAQVVSQISFDEAQELAHFGAKVLHPRTIRPAVARDIPVRILSTFAPFEPGTLVTREWTGERLKAVTAMKNLQLITIDVPELEDLSGAASAVFGAMHEERMEVVLVSQASSRRRMTYLIDSGTTGGCEDVTARLHEALIDFEAEVGCRDQVALVAAVGHGAAEQPRALAQVLEVLGKVQIPVLASSQQMSNSALVAAIPAEHAETAVIALHEAFIGSARSTNRTRRTRKSRMLSESVQVG